MPACDAKYPAIAQVIERRIKRGDYAVNRLPSGRKLSAELGISYVTARKAIKQVVANGYLKRDANGRLRLEESSQQQRRRPTLEIAMITPAYDSPSYADWRRGLTQAVKARGGALRHVSFVHADDPVLTEAIDAFDGVFLVPPQEISPPLRERLAGSAHKIFTLFDDLTDLGIPCVDGGPPRAAAKLVHYLAGLGHRHIDCVHVSPSSSRSHLRVEAWREALNELDLSGSIHDHPAPLYADPDVHAKAVFDRVLDGPGFEATAVFCTTATAVLGLYRSAYDHHLAIGDDLSIVTFGAADRCRLFTPSVTTLVTADPMPWLDQALKRFFSPDTDLTDAMFIEPDELELQIGESTGPANSISA